MSDITTETVHARLNDRELSARIDITYNPTTMKRMCNNKVLFYELPLTFYKYTQFNTGKEYLINSRCELDSVEILRMLQKGIIPAAFSVDNVALMPPASNHKVLEFYRYHFHLGLIDNDSDEVLSKSTIRQMEPSWARLLDAIFQEYVTDLLEERNINYEHLPCVFGPIDKEYVEALEGLKADLEAAIRVILAYEQNGLVDPEFPTRDMSRAELSTLINRLYQIHQDDHWFDASDFPANMVNHIAYDCLISDLLNITANSCDIPNLIWDYLARCHRNFMISIGEISNA